MPRILVADHGPRAIAVMTAAARLGWETVSVFSTEHLEAPHVEAADFSVHLSGSPAAEVYLDRDMLVAAAMDGGCDAIHPGFAGLACDPGMAEAARLSGLGFVGCPAPCLEVLRDRRAVRERVKGLVHAPPWFDGDAPEAARWLSEQGLPGRLRRREPWTGDDNLVRSAEQLMKLLPSSGHRPLLEARASRGAVVQVILQGNGRGGSAPRTLGVVEVPAPGVHIAPAGCLRSKGEEPLLAAAAKVAWALDLEGVATISFTMLPDGMFCLEDVLPYPAVGSEALEAASGLSVLSVQLGGEDSSWSSGEEGGVAVTVGARAPGAAGSFMRFASGPVASFPCLDEGGAAVVGPDGLALLYTAHGTDLDQALASALAQLSPLEPPPGETDLEEILGFLLLKSMGSPASSHCIDAG